MKSPPSLAVFLGPSLPVDRARKILEACYLPPARRGDIYRVMTSGVKTIVLIDGVFHNTPSVWQRELLDAIEEGIQVFGASSMGALRAAELHRLGMQGFGVVFEWYRDQLIEGDDEVALLHVSEEFNYRGLSVPMVNIRYTLAQAVREGLLDARIETNLLDYVKSLPYPERNFEAVLNAPSLNEVAAEDIAALKSYLETKRVDIKMQDAVGVLRHVKALSCEDQINVGSRMVPRTSTTRQQLDRALMTRFYAAEGTFDGFELLERAQSNTSYIELIRGQLSARRFILEWATQNQLSCPEDVLQNARDNFADSRHIADMPAWLRANGLTYPSFIALLNEDSLLGWLESEPQTLLDLNGDAVDDLVGDIEEKTEQMKTCFILEWARQNGVTVPDQLVEPELQPDDRLSATPGVRSPRLLESAFVNWIIAKEPAYFGIDWRFELDLLRSLQINGQAGQVYFQNQAPLKAGWRERGV